MTIEISCDDYLNVLERIGGESVSLVLTDPPYGINYQNNYTKKKLDVLANDDSFFSYEFLAEESYRIMRNGGAFFAFTGWSEYPHHFYEVKKSGLCVKEPLIGKKRCAGGLGDLKGSFQSNVDWIIFATKGRFEFSKVKLLKNKKAGTIPNPGRRPTPDFKERFPSCWTADEFPYSSENPSWKTKHEIDHPTVKGREFIEWLIQLTTREGDLVVDPFVGSGTVAVACKALGRRFIGCDISPDFVKLAERRLSLMI